MTVDMTPVRSPSRSKMPSARSRTCVASTKSGPIGRREDQRVDVGARRQQRDQLVRAAGQDLAGEPCAPACEVDHPDLAQGGGQAAIVAELLRELDARGDRPPRHRRGRSRSRRRRTTRRAGSAGAPGRARGSPGAPSAASPRSAARARTRRASSAAASSSWLIRSADARRSWTSSSTCRIAHRLGERGQLRQAIEPLAGPAEDGERVVARREEDPPVGRRRHHRERLLDEPERLLGGVGGEGGRRGIDREARGPRRVAGRERVLGEHRQAGGGRIATLQQQVDDRGVDLPPTRRRQLVRGELADLLVRERVVRGLALRLRQQEARPDGRREIVGQRVGAVAETPRSPGRRGGRCAVAATAPTRCSPSPIRARIARRSRRLKLRPRIAASPSAATCPGRESRGAAIDEGPDRGWHEPGRVAAEPPLAVDLLERAGLAVRPGQLLDDERHALGLDVHRGRGYGLDRSAEDALQELPRLDRAEPSGPQPPDEAHPLHVGDEVHRLGDRCELVRPDRQRAGRSADRRRSGRRTGEAGGCRRRPTGRRR